MISVQRNERHFESIDEAVASSVFFFVGRCRGWGLGEGPIFMSHESVWNSKRLLDIDTLHYMIGKIPMYITLCTQRL